MHGAGQARVKGMYGAQNLYRLGDLCHRGANQRLFKEERCPLASRGEPFHVVGTTS